jgi:hypothetical protein
MEKAIMYTDSRDVLYRTGRENYSVVLSSIHEITDKTVSDPGTGLFGNCTLCGAKLQHFRYEDGTVHTSAGYAVREGYRCPDKKCGHVLYLVDRNAT